MSGPEVPDTAALRSLLEAVVSRPYAGSARWSWGPHGQGFALYIGRDGGAHGLNVLSASNADAFDARGPQLRALIEGLLNAAPALLAAEVAAPAPPAPVVLDPRRLAQIDSGIRGVVDFLLAAGFRTIDSGDGVSKASDPNWEEGEFCDFPHVFMEVPVDRMIQEADRLRDVLAAAGLVLGDDDATSPHVEVSYAPGDGKVILTLFGVDDAYLRACMNGADGV
jgi:hypothetical protein